MRGVKVIAVARVGIRATPRDQVGRATKPAEMGTTASNTCM
jgi:hypothetical protein